jgi:hypothetical protein
VLVVARTAGDLVGSRWGYGDALNPPAAACGETPLRGSQRDVRVDIWTQFDGLAMMQQLRAGADEAA